MFSNMNAAPTNQQKLQQQQQAPSLATATPTTATSAAASHLLTPDELAHLQELHAELNDAKTILAQTQEAADRQELTILVEDMLEQISEAVLSVAWAKLGIKPVANTSSLNQHQQQQGSVEPARHLLRWDDGKLFACDITSIFFEADEIRCTVKIVGFPENNRKNDGKGEVVSLERNIVGNWDPKMAFAFVGASASEQAQAQAQASSASSSNNNNNKVPDATSTTTVQAGSKCFAIDLSSQNKFNSENQIFVPVVVERMTMHGTAWVQPITSTQQQNGMPINNKTNTTMNVGFSDFQQQLVPNNNNNNQTSSSTAFEVPISYTRPYCLPPPQGKYLRRKWENLSEEEKNQLLDEKKKKQNDQQEQKRRQRTESINQQANDWQKMKAMMGGRKF